MAIAIEDLPCLRCPSPQGADVRHCIGQFGGLEEAQCSPTTGLPIGCCRIRSVPLVQQESDLAAR
jgi:hypothetical protein